MPHVCNHQVRVEATDDSDLVLFPEEVFSGSVEGHAADSDMLLPRAEAASTWSQRKGKGKGQRKGQDQSRRGSRVAPAVSVGFSMQKTLMSSLTGVLEWSTFLCLVSPSSLACAAMQGGDTMSAVVPSEGEPGTMGTFL